MTRIYLVRHDQSEGNLYRRAHGRYDSLVTPQGYAQLEALKQAIRLLMTQYRTEDARPDVKAES